MSKLTVDKIRKIAKSGRTWDTANGLHVLAMYHNRQSDDLCLYWGQKLTIDGRSTWRTYGRVNPKAKDLARQIKEQRSFAQHRFVQAKRNGHVSSPGITEPGLFKNVMVEVYQHKLSNKCARYRKEWMQKMNRHAKPLFDRHVAEIESIDIANALAPIWGTKIQTARHVRKAIELVFDYAKFKKLVTGDNPAGAALLAGLPDVSYRVKHHASVPYAEVGATMNKIMASSSSHAVTGCLLFIALTAVRSQEARGARWDEIDWKNRLWNIPASRMKKRRPHRVPLSDAAMKVLKAAHHHCTGQVSCSASLVFPGRNHDKELTAAALSEACRRNKLGCSPHGFRSSFRRWCQDTGKDYEASELCLAHRIGNSAVQAYAYGDIIEKRKEIMQEWADYIEQSTRKPGATP